jgi:hypothetical protein
MSDTDDDFSDHTIESNLIQRRLPGLTTDLIIDKLMMVGDIISGGALYPYQIPFARRVFESVLEREAEEITALFSRQCIGPNQVVTQRDGTLTRMSVSERSWQTKTRAPVYRLRLKGGACIDEVTMEHVFFSRDGEKALKDLRVGDEIAFATEVSSWRGDTVLAGRLDHNTKHGNRPQDYSFEWSPELALLLGYMTSDGTTAIGSNQAPKFTNIDHDYLKEFEALCHKCFPSLTVKWREKGKGYDLFPYSGRRTQAPSLFKSFLRLCDFDHGFPRAISATSEPLAAAFIRGLLNGDGCVQASNMSIELACGNDIVYARYCQALLLKLGVRASLKTEVMAKSTAPFHRLVMSGAGNLRLLSTKIGFLGGHKTDAHLALLEAIEAQANGTGSGNTVRLMYKPEESGPHGETIAYSRITEISFTGYADVYDREEPDKGWFICQGIKTHNSGKSQCLSYVSATLMVMMPALSREFEGDDRFNYYDKRSNSYRSYANGFWIGIFAPKKEQATIIFNRVRNFMRRKETLQILAELGVSYETNNGDRFRLSSGSTIKCSTASDQASIEGDTLHLALLEESQDISDEKANKSIGPMLASTSGTLVKIGTANARKSHFYLSLRRNERRASQGAKVNHFSVPWDEAAKSNVFYDRFVRKEMTRLGEMSDEFRMNFNNEFMLERGVAISEALFRSRSVTQGPFSDILPGRRHGMSYVAGIDFGKVHDSTVVTILEVNWNNPRQVVEGFDNEKGAFTVEIYGKHIADWLEMQGDDYEAQYHEIKKFLNKWGIERMCLDYTGVGVSLGDRFKAMFDSVDVEFLAYSDDSKDMLGRQLLADLHSGMLTWPAGEECRARRVFRNFQTQMLDAEKDYRNGLLNLHHPDIRGAHDDFVQSACLAIQAACTKPFGGQVEESEGWLRG